MRFYSSLKMMAMECGGIAARCLRTENGREAPLAILLQVLFPFTVAGMGMVAAGFVFDYVDKWQVFSEISEIIVMIPALLGLKGNLEMTLAARLSTASNLGRLDKLGSACNLILSNLALLQCQGVVLGCLVAVGAVLVGVITDGPQPVKLDHALVLLSSSMLTASICSAVLGVIMAAVIVAARKLNINPDNVATPIAAALGDITSLGLLAHLVSALHKEVAQGRFTAHVIISCYALVALGSGYIAWRNRNTKAVMVGGWVPVLLAMTISSGAGVILERAAAQFDVMTQFQTVFNGVGGNLAAIQASRISTSLHSQDMDEKLLETEKRGPSREGAAQSSFTSEKSETSGAVSVRTDTTSTTTLPEHTSTLPDALNTSSCEGIVNPSYTPTPPTDTSIMNDSTESSNASLHSFRNVNNVRKSSVSLPTPRKVVKAEITNTSLPPFLYSTSKTDGAVHPSFLMNSMNNSKNEAVNASTPIGSRTSAIFGNASGSTNIGGADADEDDFEPNQFFLVRGGSHAATARWLLLLVPPGHGLFLYIFVLIKNNGPSPSALFVVMFLLSTLVQVTILLQCTQMLVCWFWNRGTDPDSSAIPYLTALGDLLGVSLLTMTCYILQFAQDTYVLHDGDAIANHNLTTLSPLNLINATTHSPLNLAANFLNDTRHNLL